MNIYNKLLGHLYYRGKAAAEKEYIDTLRGMCIISNDAVFYPTAKVATLSKKEDILIEAYAHIRGELFTYHKGNIHIGEYCYVGERTKIWAGESIWIGNRVLIAHDCNIFDNNTHPTGYRERHEHFKTIIFSGHPDIALDAKEIKIEDDVWIGCGVTILKGVTIGKGAIIGAGSVVTKNVPAFAVAAGNPAQVVKYINEKPEAMV